MRSSFFILLLSTSVLLVTDCNADVVTFYGTDVINDETQTINQLTGEATIIGPTGFFVTALAYDSNRRTLFGYASTSARLIEIDIQTGAGSIVGTRGGGQISGLAFDQSQDRLYGIHNPTNSLFLFDRDTGGVTTIANLSKPSLNGLTFDPASGLLYTFDDGDDQIATIDPISGDVTTLGPLGGVAGARIAGLDFDPSSGLLLGIEILSDQLVEIDTTTGAITPIGGSGLNGIVTLAAVSVPEPASFVVPIISLSLVVLRRSRVK